MRRCQRFSPPLMTAIVATMWLFARPDSARALILAPYDADSECSSNATNSSSSVAVLIDSYSYLSLDRLWFADDESIDLFTFPVPADPEVWELVDNTDCRNVWRYCGGSTSDILLTQFISPGAVAGAELIVQIDYAFVSENYPSSPLSCSASSEDSSVDNENVLIIEVDDTFTVYSEQIPCGAGRLVNASAGIHQYQFTFTPMDSFEVVIRSNLSDDSCVYVSRVLAFHHICPETTVNYVRYPPTPGGLFAGTCVQNAQPLSAQDNVTALAQCSHLGEWIFPPNLTTSNRCLCGPGYFPDSLGIECLPCSNGTYKTGFGQEACLPCPGNSHTDDQGGSFCQCNPAFSRADPSDVDTDCEVCAMHYFPTEGTCNPCPAPGAMTNSAGILLEECMCLNGTTISNFTQDSNFTRDINLTICMYCAQDYYRSQSNESCLLCPQNSFRDPDLHSENTCYCTMGSLTADGQTQTTQDPCDRYDTTHFLFESRCRPCPEYSSSRGLSDTECVCETNTTTHEGATETRGDACLCNAGLFRSQGGNCVPCPPNSYRGASLHDDYCPCETGYARRPNSLTTERCYGPVVGFNQQAVQVFEGDSTNMVAVRVYSTFPIPRTTTINVNVTTPVLAGSSFIDQLIFPAGETQADYHVIIQGDEVALETDQLVQVQLIQGVDINSYIIGSGDLNGNQSYHSTINVTIREDDVVYVGFTRSNISTALSSRVLELVVAISTDISRDLAVLVTSNISLSVFSIQNTVVTFVPGGSSHLVVPIQLSTESDSLVDAYYVGVTLELVEEEYLRNEVEIGGQPGFNERLILTLLPQQSTRGLTQGAEIGIISACASALIVVLALLGVLIYCYARQKYKEKHYHKSDCSSRSEDDFDSEGMIELQTKVTKLQ